MSVNIHIKVSKCSICKKSLVQNDKPSNESYPVAINAIKESCKHCGVEKNWATKEKETQESTDLHSNTERTLHLQRIYTPVDPRLLQENTSRHICHSQRVKIMVFCMAFCSILITVTAVTGTNK